MHQNDQTALRALEQNVILRFSASLRQRFSNTTPDKSSTGFADTTLGSQDKIFADYLIAANARFALVEFKASFLDIRSEAKKPLRRSLFDHLALRDDMLRRCLDFHYICWGVTSYLPVPSSQVAFIEESEFLNHYALQVAPFMVTKPRLKTVADFSTTSFLDSFLGARLVGGNIHRFRTYVNELAAIAGGTQGDASTLEGMVFAFVPGDANSPGRYAHGRFRGLDHLDFLLAAKPNKLGYDRRPGNEPKPQPDYLHRSNGGMQM